MSFGNQLQALRRANGLTQEAFAQQLQVSRQAVSKWESGKGYPEIEKILYICNYYHVYLDDLFSEELPPKASEDEVSAPSGEPTLNSPSIQRSFGSFFTNLSPSQQGLFGMGAALIAIVLLIMFCTTVMKGESDQMLMKLIWTGLLVVFVVGEAITVGLTSIWFAAGALIALIAAMLGAGLWVQLTLFILGSALSLVAFRPLAKKYINGKVEPTNVDRLIGTEVLVTEAIDNLHSVGAVRIGGIIWTARSEDDIPIPEDTLVRVVRIEGVKVYVKKAKEEL